MPVSIAEEHSVVRVARYALAATPITMMATLGYWGWATLLVPVVFLYGVLEFRLGMLSQQKTARMQLAAALVKNGYTADQIRDMMKDAHAVCIKVQK